MFYNFFFSTSQHLHQLLHLVCEVHLVAITGRLSWSLLLLSRPPTTRATNTTSRRTTDSSRAPRTNSSDSSSLSGAVGTLEEHRLQVHCIGVLLAIASCPPATCRRRRRRNQVNCEGDGGSGCRGKRDGNGDKEVPSLASKACLSPSIGFSIKAIV